MTAADGAHAMATRLHAAAARPCDQPGPARRERGGGGAQRGRGRARCAAALALLAVLLAGGVPRSESGADCPPPHLADLLRWRDLRAQGGWGRSSLPLRLAGGGSAGGLGWIERRLTNVFNSASKASSSSPGPLLADTPVGGAGGADPATPAPGKSALWERFERGFDSLQGGSAAGKDPFRSLSPMSSPEGPYQPSDGGDGVSPAGRPPSRKITSWIARRFNDAFASDAPSPGDASLLSHAAGSVTASQRALGHAQPSRIGAHADDSPRGMSSGSWAEEGPLTQEQARQSRHAEASPRFEHPSQHGSEVSEEAAAGGGAENTAADTARRGEERTGVGGSFMLRLNKRPVAQKAESESWRRGSVDDIGLPTPLRAEWGPALNTEQDGMIEAGWELPSISLAARDPAAAVSIRVVAVRPPAFCVRLGPAGG
jgi:hypothetical protein